MAGVEFVRGRAGSVVKGPPLAEEPGLGALTLAGFIREVTERYTDREVLVERRRERVVRWSFGELWDRAVAVARALVACGLGKNERVGVLMTNRPEFLPSVFGVALAGGVPALLSTFSTAFELQHLLASSGCSILLLEPQVQKKDFARMLEELEPAITTAAPGEFTSTRFPYLRHLATLDAEAPRGAIETWDSFLARAGAVSPELVAARAAAVSPADPGGLFFSSGSTNRPKGILSSQRAISLQLWRMSRQQGLGDGVRYWTANGFFWSGNFAMALGATLAAGGTLVLQRTFDPAEALELMQEERVDFLFAWPHQWAQLMAAPNWDSVDLSALKYVDVDSPIARHPTVRTSWIEPRHAYGNTETFSLSTGYPANTPREVGGHSHGVPLPGNTIKIVDAFTGAVMPLGKRGEIAVKGPTLMMGYLGVPLDETLDDEGYFRTGDGGYLDPQGRLVWEGRLNDIIKTGGANVSPVEVDSVLQDCPGVKLVQTVGVPHETLGEMVVSCVVPNEGASLDEETVRSFARQKLASYKAPRRVLFVAEGDLRLTGSAKVKTSDLRKLAATRLDVAAQPPPLS
jgi:acyl-CoA synthetase (AMP-forming)/AMP-acid ligase II